MGAAMTQVVTRTKVQSLYRMGPWAACDICGGQTRCRVREWPRSWHPRHMICETDWADRRRRQREEQGRRDERAARSYARPSWSHSAMADLVADFGRALMTEQIGIADSLLPRRRR